VSDLEVVRANDKLFDILAMSLYGLVGVGIFDCVPQLAAPTDPGSHHLVIRQDDPRKEGFHDVGQLWWNGADYELVVQVVQGFHADQGSDHVHADHPCGTERGGVLANDAL